MKKRRSKTHWDSRQSERLCRQILEVTLGVELPDTDGREVQVQWLRNGKGNRLQIDGLNEAAKFAFEYQGHQHYQALFPNHDLQAQQASDKYKRDLCAERNITLIVIPFFSVSYRDKKAILAHVQVACREAGIDKEVPAEFSYDVLKDTGPAKKLNKIVAARRGQVVSEYLGERIKVGIKCANSQHPIWYGMPHHIKSSKRVWCRRCSHTATAPRLTLAKIAEKVARVGYVLLSHVCYRSSDEKLIWLCPKNHQCTATYANVIKNKGCSDCGNVSRSLTRRVSTFEIHVNAIKGKLNPGVRLCSARSDIQSHKITYTFECLTGHEWEWTEPVNRNRFRPIVKCGMCHKMNLYVQQSAAELETKRLQRNFRAMLNQRARPTVQEKRERRILFKVAKYEAARRIVEYRGGSVISLEYISAHAPFSWNCGNPDHPPQTTSVHSLEQGHWCKKCTTSEVARLRCAMGIHTPTQRKKLA